MGRAVPPHAPKKGPQPAKPTGATGTPEQKTTPVKTPRVKSAPASERPAAPEPNKTEDQRIIEDLELLLLLEMLKDFELFEDDGES